MGAADMRQAINCTLRERFHEELKCQSGGRLMVTNEQRVKSSGGLPLGGS